MHSKILFTFSPNIFANNFMAQSYYPCFPSMCSMHSIVQYLSQAWLHKPHFPSTKVPHIVDIFKRLFCKQEMGLSSLNLQEHFHCPLCSISLPMAAMVGKTYPQLLIVMKRSRNLLHFPHQNHINQHPCFVCPVIIAFHETTFVVRRLLQQSSKHECESSISNFHTSS